MINIKRYLEYISYSLIISAYFLHSFVWGDYTFGLLLAPFGKLFYTTINDGPEPSYMINQPVVFIFLFLINLLAILLIDWVNKRFFDQNRQLTYWFYSPFFAAIFVYFYTILFYSTPGSVIFTGGSGFFGVMPFLNIPLWLIVAFSARTLLYIKQKIDSRVETAYFILASAILYTLYKLMF